MLVGGGRDQFQASIAGRTGSEGLRFLKMVVSWEGLLRFRAVPHLRTGAVPEMDNRGRGGRILSLHIRHNSASVACSPPKNAIILMQQSYFRCNKTRSSCRLVRSFHSKPETH
jgi:hypothetical protein